MADLCTGAKYHTGVYLVSPQLVPLSSLHIKMPQRLRKLSLYEKWSSRNLFPHHILCYQEIRKYGGALWRKHSCSVHLYQSCNLHWKHLTLRVWENDFLLQRAPSTWRHSRFHPPDSGGVKEYCSDENMNFNEERIIETRAVTVYLFILSVIGLYLIYIE